MNFDCKRYSWYTKPEPPIFRGNCVDCVYFDPCPCGCNWGTCGLDKDDIFDGTEQGCKNGYPIGGIFENPIDENEEYEYRRDNKE